MDKKVHIELLRIIAMFLVMFNHTWIRGFTYFNSCVGTPWYWVYLFPSILVKIDVPIFFMISGALLLKKEEAITDLYRKRVSKALITLILFSLISYIYLIVADDVSMIYGGEPITNFDLIEFIKAVYHGSITTQYWFLYRYIAFLLLLPLLRILVKHMKNVHYMYMVGLFLLVQCVNILQYAVSEGTLTYNYSFDLFILQDIIIFPLMGHFVENVMPEEKINPSLFFKLCVASFISVMVTCIMTWYSCTIIDEWYESTCQTFFNNLIIIPTVTAYVGAIVLFRYHQFKEPFLKIITIVGSTTFGIFLLEQIYRNETFEVYNFFAQYVNSFFASVLWIACAFTLGFLVTIILKQIPVLKKIL